MLSGAVSSRDLRYGRIQPGLRLSAGSGRRHSPEPLALLCGEMLQLFWQASVSPGAHPAFWLSAASLCSRRGCCCRSCSSWGIFGCWEGWCPQQGWCSQQGCCPGPGSFWRARGDVTCGTISKALPCATWLDATGFVPGYFGIMAERLPGTCAWARPRLLPGAAPGGTPGTAAGDEPCGSGQGHFHPASHRGLPTSDAFPVSGAAPHPFPGLHPPATAPGLGWSGAGRANAAGRRHVGG